MKNNNSGLTLFSCVTMIVGGMIGSAIFSLSGVTILQAGPASIFSWVIAAVIMLFYGLICCELAIRYPKTGGVYVFPRMAFNSYLLGWVSNWGYITSNIIANSFSAVCVGTYLSAGFGISDKWTVLIGLIFLALCLVLNLVGIMKLGKFNSILVVFLLISIVVYAVCSIFSGSLDFSLLKPFFAQGVGGENGFVKAVPIAMVAYGNIVIMSFMASEVRDPNRTIPRSAQVSMTIVALIYLVTVGVTVCMVSVSFLTENPGMTYIPLYAACFTKLTMFPWMSKVVSVGAVLALFTTMLILTACTSQSLAASAEEKIVPQFLTKKNKFGNPYRSTVIISLCSAILACFPGLAGEIVNYGALFSVFTMTLNIISLYKSRKISKEYSFTVPGGKVLPALVLAAIIACYIPDLTSGWKMWVVSLIVYAFGYLIYIVSFDKTRE